MKKFKDVFLFLLIGLTSTGLAQPSGWKLSRNANGVKVWQMISNSDVTGSMEKRKTKTKIDWSEINKMKGGEFFEKFKHKKRKAFSLIGISEWKAHKHKWTSKGRYHWLEVAGSYTDTSGKKVVFMEVHIYTMNQSIQILHTRPESIRNGKKLSKEIIAYMKKEAGIE